MTGAELLKRIPEDMRGEKLDCLDHFTPVEVAEHFDACGCRACGSNLRRLVEHLEKAA